MAVRDHQVKVGVKVFERHVVLLAASCKHRSNVHRRRDHFIVIGCELGVDWLAELERQRVLAQLGEYAFNDTGESHSRLVDSTDSTVVMGGGSVARVNDSLNHHHYHHHRHLHRRAISPPS